MKSIRIILIFLTVILQFITVIAYCISYVDLSAESAIGLIIALFIQLVVTTHVVDDLLEKLDKTK